MPEGRQPAAAIDPDLGQSGLGPPHAPRQPPQVFAAGPAANQRADVGLAARPMRVQRTLQPRRQRRPCRQEGRRRQWCSRLATQFLPREARLLRWRPVRLAVRADVSEPLIRDVLAAAAERMRVATTDTEADVWLARRADGALVLGDGCYTSFSPLGSRTLLELMNPTPGEVTAALEHYRQYNEPVRMAERCHDLPKALEMEILDCSNAQRPSALATVKALQDPELTPVRLTHDGIPLVQVGQRFCVRVSNISTRELVVVGLLCCTSDGQVELFGEELVPALGRTTFWLGGQHGNPFVGWLPKGRVCAYERLIAIGTTVAGISFAHLRLTRTFDIALRSARSRPPVRTHLEARVPPKPPERWTGLVREVLFER